MVLNRINWIFRDKHGNGYVRNNDTMELIALDAYGEPFLDEMRKLDGSDRRIVSYYVPGYAIFEDGSMGVGQMANPLSALTALPSLIGKTGILA